jgi:hypothetical protein
LYELIQNADDNSYNVEKPSLTLKLSEITIKSEKIYALTVINNESGFTKENVDAICRLGKSTKSKDFDTIGEKGIGFKSVFKLTDCPYIYSNGFSFKVPENNPYGKGVGYIVPYWVESFPVELENHREDTCIILPINKDISAIDVAKNLDELSEFSILFLRKVKELIIDINIPEIKQKKVISRIDETNSKTILINDNNNTHEFTFYTYVNSIIVPDDISHEKRLGLENRQIEIAIPISQMGGFLYWYAFFIPAGMGKDWSSIYD